MSLLTRNPARGGDWAPDRLSTWQSLTTIRRSWVAGAFAVCALFGLGVIVVSTDHLHRTWGLMAACGYGTAALSAWCWRSRRGLDLALLLSLIGGLILPLIWMTATGNGEPEVAVIFRSAEGLVHHGDPYNSAGVLRHTTDPNLYDPYLPAMTAFGLLWATVGPHMWTDPRVWFGIAFAIFFALALRVARARDVARWTMFVTATPIIAFELTVGGTDVPIIALICLGFALMWRHPRPVLAGLAFGGVASMKATAWPAVAVAICLALARDGKRSAAVMTGVVAAVFAVVVGPFAVLQPSALARNTISFPLGLASVASDAASPLPGHAIADTGHIGRMIVIALLILSAVGVAASLVIQPPRTVPSAVIRLVVGLTLMFVLAPATRFGYFIYPADILAWMVLSYVGQGPPAAQEISDPPSEEDDDDAMVA